MSGFRIGDSFAVHRMSGGNDNLHLWLDVKAGRFWYVFMWLKGKSPYAYRSTDATPPTTDNEGRWLFGRKTGARF